MPVGPHGLVPDPSLGEAEVHVVRLAVGHFEKEVVADEVHTARGHHHHTVQFWVAV